MRDFTSVKKYLFISLLLLSLSLSLNGCMEAGAADWIGIKPKPVETVEEPSTEEKVEETVGEVDGGDKEIENALPTFSIEEEPLEGADEELIEEDWEPEEEEEEEVSDNSVSEDAPAEEAVTDDGDNHDVTKGSWDGDDWSAEATIGADHKIEVTVSSIRSAMVQEKVTDYSPAAEKKGKNIDDARFAYFTKYEEGDKNAAASDVEDYEDVEEMSKKQYSAFMEVADDIGKLIAQFGITNYDFKHPAENNDDEIIIDLYRKDKYQYLMTLTFDEDNGSKLLSIDFSLEE